ncbi:MAG: RES family NAD+ phosphorylase [Candidatus Eremiobacteraeota bacterium]|nr:RES family NAD+ phosphorylase [Candidatus Eremiobacteraeota bacterium]MBV8366072.1 RES family NAD+ phosphorylase [Candidatus Eremiobacteraeota bacterium]
MKIPTTPIAGRTWRLVSPPLGAVARIAIDEDAKRAAAATMELAQADVIKRAHADPEYRPLLRRPGWEVILYPFVRLGKYGSRFSDGSYGVFYAAFERRTAIAETVYHRTRLLAQSSAPPALIPVSAYAARIAGEYDDIRDARAAYPGVYAKDQYHDSQRFGRERKGAGSNGIAYTSVRIARGSCIGIFAARTISSCSLVERLRYEWDGARIARVYVRSAAAGASARPAKPK